MFKKLLDGELSLKDTFWKFGVLGMLAARELEKSYPLTFLAPRL